MEQKDAAAVASSSKPQVAFWRSRQTVEPIRLLLRYVGQDFEDIHYYHVPTDVKDNQDELKSQFRDIMHTLGLDFPDLPYYIDGDVKLTQQYAILRYLGDKYDLCGHTEEQEQRIDQCLEFSRDVMNYLIEIMFYTPDSDSLLEFLEHLPEFFAQYANFLGGRPFFAGPRLTFIDFVVYDILDEIRRMKSGCLDAYPILAAFMDRIEAFPKIKEYINSDKFLGDQISSSYAKRTTLEVTSKM